VNIYKLLFFTLLLIGCSDGEKKLKQPIEKKATTKQIDTPKKDTIDVTLDKNISIIIKSDTILVKAPKEITILTIYPKDVNNIVSNLEVISKLKSRYIQNISTITIPLENNITINSKDSSIVLKKNGFVDTITSKLKIEENFKLPLSIIFKDGIYINHYEGFMPLEMFEYDIKRILHKD